MNPPTIEDSAQMELGPQLFGKGEIPLYAVLDGASVPDLVKKIYEHEPEYCCLYRGELEADMATVAPYLVRLEAGNEFTDWILLDGWGAHWGIFLSSPANLRSLRDHFRGFHTVELPDQRTVLFRYYDPRVLRTFLPACNAAELTTFFGPVQTFILEDPVPDAGTRFTFAGKNLRTEPFQLKKAS